MGQTAEGMMLNFAESGHPRFRATTALKEKNEMQRKRMKSIHFNCGDDTIELILQSTQCLRRQ